MDIETWIASFKTELSSTFQNALRGTLEAVEVEVNRVLDEKFAALMYDLERRDAISEKVHSWVECRSSRSEVQSPVEDCSLIFQEPEHLSVDAISPHSPKPVALICHQAIAIHEGDQEEDILPHNEGGSEMDMVYIQSTFLEKDWVVSLQQVTNFSSVHSKESDDNYEQCEETELQPVYSIKDDTVLNSSCVKEELSRLAASEIDESDSEQEFVSIAGEVCELGSVCIKEENSESVVAPPMEDMDDIQDIHIKGEASFQQLPESAQDESNNLANKLCIISATSLAEEVPKTEPVSELEQEQEPHLEPVVMLKKQSVSDPMAIMNKITRLEPSVRMKRIPESNLAHLLKDTFEINCTIGIKNSSVSSTTEAEMGPSNVDSTINTEGDSVSHSVEVTIHDLSESDTVVETRENSLSPPPSEQNLDSETPSVLLEMDTFESSYLVDKNGDLTSQSDPGASNSSKLDFSVKENTTYGQNSAAEANENVFSEQGGANSNVQQSDNMTPAVSSTRDRKSPSNAVPEGNITKNTTPKLSLQTTENLKRNQEKPNTGLAKKRTRLLLNGTKDLNMFGHPAFCHNKLRGSLRDGVQLGKTVHYNEERETWKKPVIPVWCGNKKGFLYKDRLGSIPVKKCIKVGKQWYSPMEFEKLGGRESSKNWKKSVKCGSAMLFTLIEVGLSNLYTFIQSHSSL
ncbi:DEAF1 factor, partial [Polypterus senegalus]